MQQLRVKEKDREKYLFASHSPFTIIDTRIHRNDVRKQLNRFNNSGHVSAYKLFSS